MLSITTYLEEFIHFVGNPSKVECVGCDLPEIQERMEGNIVVFIPAAWEPLRQFGSN